MANRSFIVGDAGGTGTQWRIVNGEDISQFETIGFNAYTHDLQDFKTAINQHLEDLLTEPVPTFLYAAGISTPQQKQWIEDELASTFPGIFLAHNDLVGVARGLCGKEAGYACILGTGSNACHYDGDKVSTVSASLGYVLGDEGSGAYMGIKLLMGVFRKHFSTEIVESFQEKYNLTSHDVIQRIYHQPRPNHFLASFAPFIYEHRNHQEIHQLIQKAFVEFFDAFFYKDSFQEYPFHFSGSIAWYFSDILRQVAADKGIHVKNIVQSPIAGLVLYHQKYD